MEVKTILQIATVLIISISNAHSKGSPWDWQSMNAKYPSEKSRSVLPHRSSTNFPEILPVNANVSVFEGHTASLPCRIKHLKEYTVSWLRGSDTTVLSVGLLTFSSDPRFRVMRVTHADDTSDWSLEINSVNTKDEGWYDCQVNTEPKVSFKSYLKVLPLRNSLQKQQALFPASASSDRSLQDAPADIRPQVIPQIQEFLQSLNSAKIIITGPAVLWKKPGEILSLKCTASNDGSSVHLLWAHNGRVINSSDRKNGLDSKKYQIEFDSLQGSNQGHLTVFDLQTEDAGTYACLNEEATSSEKPATVRVVIGGPVNQGPPVAMAQQLDISEEARNLYPKVLENESQSRLNRLESRIELLESQVNSLLRKCQTGLLVEPEGADILASRVAGRSGSSTIVHTTTIVTASILLSVLQWF